MAKRIVIDVARLQLHGLSRDIEHAGGNAVRAETVDDHAVADLPQRAAEPFGRAHEEEIVQLVEIPFVVEEQVEHAPLRRHLARQIRAQDVIVVGYEEAEDRHNEGCELDPEREFAMLAMARERCDRAAPEFGGTFADEPMFEDRTGEQCACRQHEQRHQHHPWGFMNIGQLERMAMGMIVMSRFGFIVRMIVVTGVFNIQLVLPADSGRGRSSGTGAMNRTTSCPPRQR